MASAFLRLEAGAVKPAPFTRSSQKSLAVPNSAISGHLGLATRSLSGDGASSPQSPRSRSRLTTSATKPGRCVVGTAEPHLAYDCSALALMSLNPDKKLSMKKQTVIHEHLYRNLDSISKFVQQVLQNLPTESDPKQKTSHHRLVFPNPNH
ncbi:hypothetical protein Lpp70_11312 [Lacticaseibacillus paracasei subsp. paracasei Lpp70]|nr:hypothetical protein Lpp70_11312 [Lacticaseibacillus paracasei subsp. paracasei Lpp70]